MHPARLRIHPARPGEGSRTPRAGPSGRPAPCLPGGPGGDTAGRAPGLRRSFHFESTLRKFAKLVSRWLLCASREGAAHQPAVAAAPGGSRWFQRGLGQAAWEAGRARSRAGAALPERAGPHRAARTPAAGCCLGGALRQRPLCPRSPRPRPSWAPPPAPSRIVRPLGGAGPEVRGGRIAMETLGRSRGEGRRLGPLPCGLPTGPPRGAWPRDPGRERRGRGAPRRPLPVGRWLRWSRARRVPKLPPARPRGLIRGGRRPGRSASWPREGRGRVRRCPGAALIARPGSGTAATAGGRLHTHSTTQEAKVLHPDKTLKRNRQLTGFGSPRV